jgi:hypothetical protein
MKKMKPTSPNAEKINPKGAKSGTEGKSKEAND